MLQHGCSHFRDGSACTGWIRWSIVMRGNTAMRRSKLVQCGSASWRGRSQGRWLIPNRLTKSGRTDPAGRRSRIHSWIAIGRVLLIVDHGFLVFSANAEVIVDKVSWRRVIDCAGPKILRVAIGRWNVGTELTNPSILFVKIGIFARH